MYELWKKEQTFPAAADMADIPGIRYLRVHTAVEGDYQFLLGAAVVRHRGKLYVSWANSYRDENDDNTILAGTFSPDDGATWQPQRRWSRTDPGYGRSHGVFFQHEGQLYAFCPKARFAKINEFPELQMEGYRLTDAGEWACLGIVLPQPFWPMCEPVALRDGTFLMAGLNPCTAEAAVALWDGRDITRWDVRTLPNPCGYRCWGETTVLPGADRLVAIVRGGGSAPCALVSESFDEGRTWSGLQRSNLPISHSKMYAGVLADGRRYLVFNARSEDYRETLCLALGRDCFDKVYRIRHGFDAPPRFWRFNEWSYPYAFEDRAQGVLYVAYDQNKENCELAVIPLAGLTE